MSISSPAKLGPISGNAISVSCQNSNCLRRRKRRRVIQRVKLLSSEFSAPPLTTSKAMEAARGCATKGRHHQIRRHYHYCIRLQPQSTAIFISFCFQNFSFYLGWLVKHLLPKYSSATKTYLHFFFCNPTTNSELECTDNDHLLKVFFQPLSILNLCHLYSIFLFSGCRKFF